MIPVLPADEKSIARAAEALQQGRLVAFPTETVYGLGAHALDPKAAARIFEAKQRPFFDPLIVHVGSPEDAYRLLAGPSASLPEEGLRNIRRLAETLIRAFWPGPLTLVLPKAPVVPDLITAGHPTVALRMPAHPVALSLLRAAGLPIAAPSANLFGRLSPTRSAHVTEQFGDGIEMVLEGGLCAIGVESTVLSLAGLPEGNAPCLLRAGGLPKEEIEALIGPVDVPAFDPKSPEAPGQLPRHYSPRTPIRLHAQGELRKALERGREAAERAADGRAETGGPEANRVAEPAGAERADGRAGAGVAERNGEGNQAGGQRPSRNEGGQAGFLLFSGDADALRRSLQERGSPKAALEILSPDGNLREAAARLFEALHRLDAAGVETIEAELAPEAGLGLAINDRLRRARGLE